VSDIDSLSQQVALSLGRYEKQSAQKSA
jgi:hypothetical protein